MALTLKLVIAGSVTSTTTRLLANGTEIAITGGAYEAEVPVVNGIVALTSIDVNGVEVTRTIQVATAGGVTG